MHDLIHLELHRRRTAEAIERAARDRHVGKGRRRSLRTPPAERGDR